MGPTAHCKHVSAVLYGLCKFCECRDFVTVQTCTKQLQTFHQTKKHLGTPVKAQNLSVHVHAILTMTHGLHNTSNNFKNTVINSGVMCTAPICQILQSANPLAILLDHDYHCKTDPFALFLRCQRIAEITKTEADALQQATLGQSANPIWRQEHHKRLISSTFGKICKMTERTNNVLLAKSLLTYQELTTAALRHGQTYEVEAVKKYEDLTGTGTSKW